MHESEIEAALVRPFLARPAFEAFARSDSHDSRQAEPAMVRSYAMTSGRAQGSIELEIEAMLQVTAGGLERAGSLTFERAAIVHLCRAEILSIAELSARLKLPIGVIRVVASDLIEEGVLDAFLPSLGVAEDVDLISRLIEGVRAL
jgi:Protein of unknown function (DUF742)